MRVEGQPRCYWRPSVGRVELVDLLASSLRRGTAALGVELVAVVGYGSGGWVVSVHPGEAASVGCAPLTALRPVLAAGAQTLLLLHTHVAPSPPSVADHAVTRRLRAACALLGVGFAGHFVVDPTSLQHCDGSGGREAA